MTNYPPHAASLILQEASDLSDDNTEDDDDIISTFDDELNALSSMWSTDPAIAFLT